MAAPPDPVDVANLPTIELHPCYLFDCSECGSEGHQRTVTRFLDVTNEKDADEIEQEQGEDSLEYLRDNPSLRATVQTFPASVVCKSCGSRFKAALSVMNAGWVEGDEEEGE